MEHLVCKLCPKSAKTYGNVKALRRHYNWTHQERVDCHYCTYSTTRNGMYRMRQHEAAKHSDRPPYYRYTEIRPPQPKRRRVTESSSTKSSIMSTPLKRLPTPPPEAISPFRSPVPITLGLPPTPERVALLSPAKRNLFPEPPLSLQMPSFQDMINRHFISPSGTSTTSSVSSTVTTASDPVITSTPSSTVTTASAPMITALPSSTVTTASVPDVTSLPSSAVTTAFVPVNTTSPLSCSTYTSTSISSPPRRDFSTTTSVTEPVEIPLDSAQAAAAFPPSIDTSSLAPSTGAVYDWKSLEPPSEFDNSMIDPRLGYLGAPSSTDTTTKGSVLRKFKRQALREGQDRQLYIRETEYVVTKREKAILKDGTVYELVSTWYKPKNLPGQRLSDASCQFPASSSSSSPSSSTGSTTSCSSIGVQTSFDNPSVGIQIDPFFCHQHHGTQATPDITDSSTQTSLW